MRLFRTVCLFVLLFCVLSSAALVSSAEEYTYTVRLYAGNIGTVQGKQVIEYKGLHAGDRVTFSLEDVAVTEPGKYYAKGFRESGRDNDTVGASSFVVTRDADYVVAYGVPGDQVAYTVRYVDQNGAELAPDATFYGNVGDKPVVAFLYFDGYRPQAYNLTKTLSENSSENVFIFTYRKADSPSGNNAQGQTAVPETNVPAPQTDRPEADTSAVPDTASAPDASLDAGVKLLSADIPEEIIDLDLPELTSESEGGSSDPIRIWLPVLIAVSVIACAALAFVLIRSRRKKRNI